MRALLGVYDKSGIEPFARALAELGWELISTGGTFATLHAAGIPVRKVEEITGFPEMLDGRVKTLHPAVHGGILARRDLPAHMEALAAHGIAPIDLVACNLYPFYATVTRPGGVPFAEAIENIDIGGPTLLRAAAKNHEAVLPVVDPADYDRIVEALRSGAVPAELRRELAWKAFAHVAAYDAAVSEWLWQQTRPGEFPPRLSIPLERAQDLRYGENPHQRAAFYLDRSLAEHGRGGIATAVQHHGKEMSYNNYLDTDAAWNCVNDFPTPACVIVKHTNPCGVATRDDLREAYRLAVIADPTSAFGGIVAFNRVVDAALAREIREFRNPNDGETRMFYEIVIAPGYTPEGLATLKGKSKDLRILEAQPHARGGLALRQVGGGWLLQDPDDLTPDDLQLRVVTERQPTPEQLRDLAFAWRVVKHVKSNAIAIAKDGRLLGMGSGQPNRVKSVEIAMEKAGEEVRGAVLASDAFFPFAWGDSIEKACQAGIAAIIHPGGALRDQDGIDCCNQYGVAMIFTGIRHFRH
ncbi:bifunctional phosphoribosylaminoimidazolecarboxamide formyltransferase/IMP cyclohydrolase [Tepidiforma sp.]|uniref:bifunctional phosphoribosylaminoimidazolecarboxamide formyltransferase/IMP cyclohydrolase n=1 Tax=Tepidiforma sp. TaxID=2682230 RepID=UPI002ADDA30C|nr:bifunctional phosphoribosylaminoimidazolecarboxamide formyltransferase/IMP cyclohydrolase [Tepidiforma sp.]